MLGFFEKRNTQKNERKTKHSTIKRYMIEAILVVTQANRPFYHRFDGIFFVFKKQNLKKDLF